MINPGGPVTDSAFRGRPVRGRGGPRPGGGQPGTMPGGEPGLGACGPELAIGGGLVVVLAVAGYAAAGAKGTVAVVLAAAIAVIALARAAPAADAPGPASTAADTSLTLAATSGYWRKLADLTSATESLASYDGRLRGPLQNLLAARLAERHDISLAADPAAARAQLLGSGPDSLWFWVDPDRPAAEPDDQRTGIRPRTLAALIDRLEKL